VHGTDTTYLFRVFHPFLAQFSKFHAANQHPKIQPENPLNKQGLFLLFSPSFCSHLILVFFVAYVQM
jgi:hypothetical protein